MSKKLFRLLLLVSLGSVGLLAEAQQAVDGGMAAAEAANAPDGGPSAVTAAPQAGGGLAARPDAGPETLQTLRAQLNQQQEQTRLLQRQLGQQAASDEKLAQMQGELQRLRETTEYAEQRAEEAEAESARQVAALRSGINDLRRADDAIVLGQGPVDLSAAMRSLPPEATYYLQQANTAYEASDLLYARYYIELALSVSQNALPGTGAPFGYR